MPETNKGWVKDTSYWEEKSNWFNYESMEQVSWQSFPIQWIYSCKMEYKLAYYLWQIIATLGNNCLKYVSNYPG